MIRASKKHRSASGGLLAALIVLVCFACDASPAFAYLSPWAEELGLESMYTYRDPQCQQASDPINVVWKEDENNSDPKYRITAGAVAGALGTHKWPRDDYKSIVFKHVWGLHLGTIGYQYIKANGVCRQDERQAATGGPLGSRYHVRLFTTKSPTKREWFVVGDAHRDQKHEKDNDNPKDHCESIKVKAKVYPYGTIVNKAWNHVATTFDGARYKLREDWSGTKWTHYWKNTQSMPQCDGSSVASSGDVFYFGSIWTADTRTASGPENILAPTISGAAEPGSALTVNPGSWTGSPGNFSYQWCFADMETDECTPLPGATGSTWTPSAEDAGADISVTVTPESGFPAFSDVVEIGPAAAPPPPKPPTISALTVSNVTIDSVTLSGSVNPEGVDGRYMFECAAKQEDSYEFTAPFFNSTEVYIPVGSSPVPVSTTITGIQPSTFYICRLMANNAGGLSYSVPESFKTKAIPIVQSLPTTEVTKSTIGLAGQIDNEEESGTYYFEYGKVAGYGSKTAEKPITGSQGGFQPFTAAVEELPVGWTIHYRLVFKTNTIGTYYGSDKVATTAWANESSTGPAGAFSDQLADVSCAAAANCIAVGNYVVSSPAGLKPAAQKWNGTSWTQVAPPAPEGLSELRGVSCPTTSYCMAVGVKNVTGIEQPLAMQWNGSTWSTTAAPTGPGYRNYLNDVSCTAANICEAVGYSTPNGWEVVRPLVSHWNGSSWTVKTSADPNTAGGEPTEEDNRLVSVSCASASVCMAVGLHHFSIGGVQGFEPLIERLSGEAWINQEADVATQEMHAEGADIRLNGVSCPTTTSCLAVGSSSGNHDGSMANSGSPESAFAQRWDGSKWINTFATTETNSPNELLSVSCSSPTSCRAVGVGPDPDRAPRGVHWTGNGEGAMVEAVREPSDVILGEAPRLNAISCPAAAECQAVGRYRRTNIYLGRYTVGWSGAGVVPKTTIGYASNVGETTATLHGNIDPGGVDTTYYFEYGFTTAYGTKTPVASAGSRGIVGTIPVDAATAVSGLERGAVYHYRIVASNGTSTSNGPDTTFETKGKMQSILVDMPVTEAFAGTTSAVSDFATKWSKPSWITGTNGKGKNNTNGWGPLEGGSSGAYFAPAVSDTASVGVGTSATLSAAPGTGGRFSLWLDMPSPATAKTGYELRFQTSATNVYTVSLKKWSAGSETTLATTEGVSFAPGSSVALTDKGGTVEAWTNTGTGFTKVLSAADTAFAGGNAGVEANSAGTTTRLTKFKVGQLLEKAASTDAALKALPMTDPFNKTDAPLSGGGAWAALAWDTGSNKTGWAEANGWSVADVPANVNGAYWQKNMVSDSGAGDATVITLGVAPGHYFSIWLNAPSPGTVKSGYELRFTESATPGSYEAKLTKWVAGTPTVLASKTGVSLTTWSRVALVDKGGVVTAWTGGSPYSQILTASDSTYSYGYGGMEATAVYTFKLREFKIGPLAPL